MNSKIKIILKIFVSFSLLFLIFRGINFQTVLENFEQFNYWYLPLILILFILNYYFSSVRWKNLILHDNADKVSVTFLTKLYFVGSFFNNFMPTSIGGDVYKIYKLGKKIDNNADAFTATFMERFTGMLALVLISYFGLVQTLDFWISQLPLNVSSNPTLVVVFEVLLFSGFWIVALIGYFALKLFSKKIKMLNDIYTSLSKYSSSRRVVIDAILTSFLVQIVAILSHWYVLKAFDIQVDLFYALFIFPVIFLAGFFIPSLNGLGVQETLYISFLTPVGINSETALAASFAYQFIRLGVSLIGGIIYATNKND